MQVKTLGPRPAQQPPSRFSRSPLRLFAQAVALKTALSFWMFFSQAGAAGSMFAFPSLSKATFTSGPEQKGSALSGSMQIRVGWVPVWYAQAGMGCLFIPSEGRLRSDLCNGQKLRRISKKKS